MPDPTPPPAAAEPYVPPDTTTPAPPPPERTAIQQDDDARFAAAARARVREAPANPHEAKVAEVAKIDRSGKSDLSGAPLNGGQEPSAVKPPAERAKKAAEAGRPPEPPAAPAPAPAAQAPSQAAPAAAAPTSAADPAAAAPAQEKPTIEETKKEGEEDPRFAERFKVLARRKYDLDQREKKVADQEKRAKTLEKLDELMETDPLAAIRLLGKDPGKILRTIARYKDGTPPAPTVQDELASLKKKVEDGDKERAASEVKAAQDAHAAKQEQFKQGIVGFIQEHKDEATEMLSLEPDQAAAAQAVFDVIALTYKKTGEILTVEQATEKVERFLLERASQLKGAKKLQATQAAPAAPSQTARPPAHGQKSPTLLSSHAPSTSAAQPSKGAEGETWDQKLERLGKTLHSSRG